MNDGPPQAQAPPQAQQGPVKVQVPCQACQQPMQVVMPMPRVFNAIDVSTIAFVHNRPDICAACGAMFLPVVEGIDENGGIIFKWQPVKGNRSPIIVGGGSNELRKAIENANIAEQIKRREN